MIPVEWWKKLSLTWQIISRTIRSFVRDGNKRLTLRPAQSIDQHGRKLWHAQKLLFFSPVSLTHKIVMKRWGREDEYLEPREKKDRKFSKQTQENHISKVWPSSSSTATDKSRRENHRNPSLPVARNLLKISAECKVTSSYSFFFGWWWWVSSPYRFYMSASFTHGCLLDDDVSTCILYCG